MKLYKYHALGNDYIVLDPADLRIELSEDTVRRICHRHYGAGSDGILLGPAETKAADFGLWIYNPDGSTAEKSGNGLRIFSRYLWDQKRVSDAPFTIETPGGVVTSQVAAGGRSVTVEMGQVSFHSQAIPVTGPPREVVNESIHVGNRELIYSAATVGNPHCVIVTEKLTETLARELGPELERHPSFPNRTNVQFVQIIDDANIRIEIWERGAGYTLASGSSSSAAAAVAHKIGRVGPDVTVHMPGGQLQIKIAPDFAITMTGGVTRVADIEFYDEALEAH